jgi:hypothetical protein
MAKGIETLAGPVSENDVIMRENEAPAGAAALMNKQVRKSVPGFYKLPSQESETPGFMKAAKAGVDQDMAQMDTISTMAGALMREGVDTRQMNPDQIIMLYEQMMGSAGDRDQFGITDATDVLNDIAPEGEKLAYINPEEAGILKMLGGAGEMTPQGIPSFFFRRKSGRTREQVKADNIRNETQRRINQGDTSAYVQRQIDRNPGQYTNTERVTGTSEAADKAIDKAGRPKEKQSVKDKLTSSIMDFFNANREDVPGSEPINPERTKTLNKIVDRYEEPPNYFGGIPTGFNILKGMGESLSAGKTRKKSSKRQPGLAGSEEDEETYTLSGLEDALRKEGLFGDFKATRPQEFFEIFGGPQTSGQQEDFGRNRIIDVDGKRDAEGNVIQKPLTGDERRQAIRYNNAIYQAREDARDDDNQMASGGGFTQPVVPGDDTTTTPSEDAYKFNVGGTMPYTDDILTGGEEMQVPVGRRMQLAKTGAMKTKPQTMQELLALATKGGGFNQLENFNNYIKRRRKFLGEEEPEYFDEDGNVRMSGMEV